MEAMKSSPVDSSRSRLTMAPSDATRNAFKTSQRDETPVMPAREVDGKR
jgi:hypothetical protein